jgi:hypothetical protein
MGTGMHEGVAVHTSTEPITNSNQKTNLGTDYGDSGIVMAKELDVVSYASMSTTYKTPLP